MICAACYSGAWKSVIGLQTLPIGCMACVQVRSLGSQVRLDARTKLLNPKWYEGMLSSGYEGVREIQKRLTNTVGWSATSGAVDNWVYDEVRPITSHKVTPARWFKQTSRAVAQPVAGWPSGRYHFTGCVRPGTPSRPPCTLSGQQRRHLTWRTSALSSDSCNH